jgi:hypothetical protein
VRPLRCVSTWPACLAVVLLAAAICPSSGAQSAPAEPLTKQRLLQTLDLLKGEAADVLVPQVQQRGVDFEMTAADEREMKTAGASDKLLSAIRKSHRTAGSAVEGQSRPAAGLPGTGPAALPGTGAPAQLPPAGTPSSGAASTSSAGGRALVLFYGTCPQGRAFTIYNATISANGRDLAKLACNTYFYSVAAPGAYTFCVNKKKCQTADVRAGLSYYFHVPAKMIGYGLDAVPVRTGDQAVQTLSPLASKRIIAGDLVSVDSGSPPTAVLTPSDGNQKGRGQ